MKTLEQVLAQRANTDTGCIDGRDVARLAQFVPVADLDKYGFVFEGPPEEHVALDFTRENVLIQLEKDLRFAFQKALDQRGLSAGLMFEVIMMWNWALEEGLEDYDVDNGYAMYGLPLLKATAVKYGFNNPIGDDLGSEDEYGEQ